MNQMIEKLKTTWLAFGGLSEEEQEFLKTHSADCIRHSGISGWVRIFFEDLRRAGEGVVYRLRPDFVEVAEEPERWFFCKGNHDIHSIPSDAELCGECIEITAEQKDYLENKPAAVGGFEWVRKVPEGGYFAAIPTGYIIGGAVNTDVLNGIRWTRVPVEQEPVKKPFDANCHVVLPTFCLDKSDIRDAAQRSAKPQSTTNDLLSAIVDKLEEIRCGLIDVEEALKGEHGVG